MELDALPRRESQGAVGVCTSDLVEGQPLLAGHLPAGEFEPDHEHVVLSDTGLGAGLAGVAVFLLIGAVELEELLVLVAKVVGIGPGQLLGQRAAEPAARFLDAFDGGAFRLCVLGRGVRCHGRPAEEDRYQPVLLPVSCGGKRRTGPVGINYYQIGRQSRDGPAGSGRALGFGHFAFAGTLHRMRRIAWYAWKIGLPIVVAAAVGWYFYDKLSRPELWTHAFHLRPEWLVPAALLYLVAHSVWARYSVTLLRNQGAKVSVSTGVRAYFISQFGKYVPGKVWVIVLRMSILGRSIGITRTAVGITAMYEALVSIGAGAMVGVLLLFTLSTEQSGLGGYNLYWVAPIALLPVGLVGLNRFVNRVNRWRKGVHAKQFPRVKLHLVLGGLLQASIGWFILGLSLWMTLRGLRADPDPLNWDTYLHLTSINALAYVIGFVAFFMPAGAGFRELALQTLLTLELNRTMDPTAAAALAAVTAIVLRLIWTTAELSAAGLLYRFAKTHPLATEPPAEGLE